MKGTMRFVPTICGLTLLALTTLSSPTIVFPQGDTTLILPKVIQLEDTITVQDAVSDWIWALFRLTTGQFLWQIDESVGSAKRRVGTAIHDVNALIPRFPPATQQTIRNILNSGEVVGMNSITNPIENDFRRVLPSITSRSVMSPADIIEAILDLTLRQFLDKIRIALTNYNGAIERTMVNLRAASYLTGNPPTEAANLRRIVDDFMFPASNDMKFHIGRLSQLLTGTILSHHQGATIRGRTEVEDKAILTKVFDHLLQIDVTKSSTLLFEGMNDVDAILDGFLSELKPLLLFYPQLKNEVELIIHEATDNIIDVVEPIAKAFLHFAPLTEQTAKFRNFRTNSIEKTLLGISLRDFLNYVDISKAKIRVVYSSAIEKIKTSFTSNPLIYGPVVRLLDRTGKKLDSAITPFLSSISPLLEKERRWVPMEEYLSDMEYQNKKNAFCDFSLITGYNSELFLRLISRFLEFNVVTASQQLSSSVFQLDTLYRDSLQKLNETLSSLNLGQLDLTEIEEVVNASITNTHYVVQPVMDVFLEFIPVQGRRSKDVLHGIMRSLKDIRETQVKAFVLFATRQMENITETSKDKIHTILTDSCRDNNGFDTNGALGDTNKSLKTGSDNPFDQVENLLNATITESVKILTPFYQTISPLMKEEEDK